MVGRRSIGVLTAVARLPSSMVSARGSITLPPGEPTSYVDGPNHVVVVYSSDGARVARVSITNSPSGWFVDTVEVCG
jgi:hypothetical protein